MGNSTMIHCCAETSRSKISFYLFPAVSERDQSLLQTSVEMPGVRAQADQQSMEFLSRLNTQAKNIRSQAIQEEELRERERERLAAESLIQLSESSVEELQEVQVVPPTPSKFPKY